MTRAGLWVGGLALLTGLLGVAIATYVGPLPALLVVALGALASMRIAGAVRRRDTEVIERLVRVSRKAVGRTELDIAELAELDRAVQTLVEQFARARKTARRAEDLRSALFEHAPGGVVLIGRGLRVIAANPGIRELVPVVPDPVGRRLDQALPAPVLVEVVREVMVSRRPMVQETRSGRFDLLIRCGPVGESAVVAVVVDVSPLRRAARARSDFVANVSHELRTPVTSISGYAETLLEYADDVDVDTLMMARAIHRNAVRLTAIFEELLELARLEAEDAPLELVSQPLHPLVAPLVDEVLEVGRLREVTVDVYDQDTVARVQPEAFRRIVGNLLANAVKFSPDGASVGVDLRAEEDEVVLEVRDRGPGIDPAHHERVFERFFRVDKGRGREFGGTGLGLALVKHLCARTDARVGVRSNPGHGATFWVRFPR
ncbi:MAG: hypothetical protein GY913_26255 [Proteobacteria bacterium]|nr:hypothetical protein [Pseudomonadota bacterium]MCP4920420.1 hypothetical protein [Pseudomonadota bacterium]